MGRGRQKAKQTKVARELKYFSPDIQYDALARELHGDSATSPNERADAPVDDLVDDDEGVPADGPDASSNGYEDWHERGSGR